MKTDLTVKDATHDLRCSHTIGNNRMDYTMDCLILKDMGDGRVKLLVFGDRHWINRDHTKKIRYLPEWRIKLKERKRNVSTIERTEK